MTAGAARTAEGADVAPADPGRAIGIEAAREAVDGALAAFLETELAGAPPAIGDPIRHAVLAPGKRIRPLLVLAAHHAGAGRAAGAAWEADPRVALLACSVELVHTYSLIHDDLPCMDDDRLRRGRPTVHVAYGVEAAILAGAALMPLAVRAIDEAGRRLALGAAVVSRLIGTLAAAAGGGGMVGGQLLDLRAEGRALSREELERIHHGKTARLLEASCVIGARAAGASEAVVARLARFGRTLGLAFQVVDDILDVTGSMREMGKRRGRDAALGKATMPSVIGLEEARRLGREQGETALAELNGLAGAAPLREMARLVVERRR
ncbi:MAG: polyprenyl synthetase family protein [Gemmatimonadota bacterium]